ncbi:thioredoxin reductase (NADPH) [Okibacterium sp. HSC-33S16]|uniref:FAD-dependent oxidoreductase n=1 Tax=Okibacterium sp. HSC-33S16 TaxID=2910965 RepID=UPI00209D6976|nr:FAD-dependent oxidoreductase [Okibacterium sp. HSC-33S16]MCP2032702.1 thioredoxin reductase (NADPH) [Okibacterium sp. HSC-33S16]
MTDDRPQHPRILVCLASPHSRSRISDELTRRYATDYDIVESASAADALDVLRDASTAATRVALVLSDDLSEDNTHGSVFRFARHLFPDVRRGLVIEWGSWALPRTAELVHSALASTQADCYVVVPRRSPDEYFHRAITELLYAVERSSEQVTPDATIVGPLSLPRVHEITRYLTRAGIRSRVVGPESTEGSDISNSGETAAAGSPLVEVAGGGVLVNPSNADLAEVFGLTTTVPTDSSVDVTIVGAGPGGLAAAVYAASEGLRTLVLERESIGGQAGSSSLIRNYLGFASGVSGADLSDRAYQQAWAFGARFGHTRTVTGMATAEGGFRLTLDRGDEVLTRSVIVASGVSYRRLAVPGLDRYVGTSVFYGATAVEAKAQTGRHVLVVGGGNSAGQAALHLARYAASVSLVVRGPTLAASMSSYLIEQLTAAGVSILTERKIVGGIGTNDELEAVVLRHRVAGDETTVPASALFITIGAAPHTDWVNPTVLRDRWGYIFTGNDMVIEGGRRAWPGERPPAPLESSVAGFFAVGDVRRGSVKRVASAVGEGSVVVSSVHAYLAESRAR